MSIILYFIKFHLISVYFFIKLFTKRKERVYLLSRQSSKPSLNYLAIIKELEKKGIDYKVTCKKVDSSINDSVRTQGHYSNTNGFLARVFKKLGSAFSYYFSLWSQMINIASSKVIIVDGYNLPVSLLKHKRGTKIIQLWHALGAIKKFGYQSVGKVDGVSPNVARILKMHAGYDAVISGSEGMNPFFAEASSFSRGLSPERAVRKERKAFPSASPVSGSLSGPAKNRITTNISITSGKPKFTGITSLDRRYDFSVHIISWERGLRSYISNSLL